MQQQESGRVSASQVKASGLVLVIEDEPEIAELIRLMLQEEGYRVVCHLKGREGLAAVGTLKPDAVVLDLCLNDMDGLKLLRELKSNPETMPTPVIIASAMTDRMTAEERDLTDEVLLKPFGFGELHRAISMAIGGASPSAPQ